MPRLVIRGRRVVEDLWRLAGAHGDATDGTGAGAPVAVALPEWLRSREARLASDGPHGVWLEAGDDAEVLAPDLGALDLVAVRFPKSTDGRGYSSAFVLRRLGFRGELRAFGDLGRDHLVQLARCGFDAFALRSREDPRAALAAFDAFSVRYQGSADDPRPLHRLRIAPPSPRAAGEHA